jgi:hypothetical protein
MSAFDNLSWLFNAALIFEKLDQQQATISIKEKLERKRNQLSLNKTKKLIKPKYEAAMLLLSE